jgi:hypothetical protein
VASAGPDDRQERVSPMDAPASPCQTPKNRVPSFVAVTATACASLLLDSGKNIRQVAAWLGHKEPAFTLRTYTHLMDAGRGDAAFFEASATAFHASAELPADREPCRTADDAVCPEIGDRRDSSVVRTDTRVRVGASVRCSRGERRVGSGIGLVATAEISRSGR